MRYDVFKNAIHLATVWMTERQADELRAKGYVALATTRPALQ